MEKNLILLRTAVGCCRERSVGCVAESRGAGKKMACGGTGCQSNCWKEEDGRDSRSVAAAAAAATPPSSSSSSDCCSKCKTQTSLIPNLPTYSHEASLCLDCFRSYLFGKFKLALTSHAMISPHDNVLVAFSAGPASRVALQFIHEMQSKAQKNFDASRDKSSLPVFGVGVALVDESAISTVPSLEVGKAIEEIRSMVSRLVPPAKELYIAPIESVYSLDSGERRGRFNELLDTVNDVTGREDLLQHLRMLCLQKIASENGYSKLVLGTCTSRMASHVIAATVKIAVAFLSMTLVNRDKDLMV
ncbi:hypothetical protein ACLOJK_009143 [Asimina triloba]